MSDREQHAMVYSETACDVRWFNGRLQQKWLIREHSPTPGIREEWRDVPIVVSPPENPNG